MGRNYNTDTIREESLSPKMKVWLKELFVALESSDINKITLSEIIELVPISRSTIYRYFKTKDEIIIAMVKQKLDSLSLKQFNDSTSNSQALEGLMDFIEFVEANFLNTSLNFVVRLSRYNHDVKLLTNDFKNELVKKLKTYYIQGVKEGAFKKGSIEFWVLLDTIFINHLFAVKYTEEGKVEELISNYVDVKMNGILNDLS